MYAWDMLETLCASGSCAQHLSATTHARAEEKANKTGIGASGQGAYKGSEVGVQYTSTRKKLLKSRD
jgi:hypothetical protein